MDTNGRRNDVINALQGYLTILNDILNNKSMIWDRMPKSLAQYEFYRQAINISPEVFVVHTLFDKLETEINKYLEVREAIENSNLNWLQHNISNYPTLMKSFDMGIEDRARHYTSSLVKLGFADENRNITSIGNLLLGKSLINRDELEKLLPIDNINLVYLRQLLKLQIFNIAGNHYSPFCFAIYILLKKDRVSETSFFEMVQGFNNNISIDSIDNFIADYKCGDVVQNLEVEIPDNIKNKSKLSEDVFRKLFKNRKSQKTVDIYWNFYNYIFDFIGSKSQTELNNLLNFYEKNKSYLNKAYGCSNNIFKTQKANQQFLEFFIEQNNFLFVENINEYLYRQFSLSKILDQIKEYSDTTKRIFKVTGIISFDNGYVELSYKELCKFLFDKEIIKNKIFGNSLKYKDYESGLNSYFCSDLPLSEIMSYENEQIKNIIREIKCCFKIDNISEIANIISNTRQNEFKQFIETKYPLEKVKNILSLFSDRINDMEIKNLVSPDSTVPTIYEYIVGIAWYYFSGKKIDLLDSYNLTLSADFEPLLHAGGGQGDIVVYESDKVVMLEVTLMNLSNQKRGEWEPVLRHSVNLKIDEESKNTNRKVITFFIAEEFDTNTINIWKAIASVPLQSTTDRNKFTDNVIIMPLNTQELSNLLDKSSNYNEIISKIYKSFETDKINFDLSWRDKILDAVNGNC